jgi:hypothetical protein
VISVVGMGVQKGLEYISRMTGSFLKNLACASGKYYPSYPFNITLHKLQNLKTFIVYTTFVVV